MSERGNERCRPFALVRNDATICPESGQSRSVASTTSTQDPGLFDHGKLSRNGVGACLYADELTRSLVSCLSARGLPEACQAFSQGPWLKGRNAASSSEVFLVLPSSTLFCTADHIPQRVDSTQLCALSGCMASSPPMPTIPGNFP
jgi:hypothetical protein